MKKNYLVSCLGVLVLLIACESAGERSAEELPASSTAFRRPVNADSLLPVTDTLMPPEFPARRIPMKFMQHSEPLPPFNDLPD